MRKEKRRDMFCPNCGSKVADNAKYCTKCGARIPDSKAEPARPAEDLSETVHLDETEDKPLLREAPLKRDAYVSTSGAAKQNRKPLMIGGAVLGLAAVVTAIAVTMGGGSEGNLKKQMKTGENYLLEENYEEAIIAFEKAIEIDPKNPEPYIRLAEIYVKRDDYRKAVEILKQAQDAGAEENDKNGKIAERLEEAKLLFGAADVESNTAESETAALTNYRMIEYPAGYLSALAPIPVMQEMTSESSILQEKGAVHHAFMAFDLKPETSWQDGRNTEIGEYVQVNFGVPQTFNTILIHAGNFHTQDLFRDNTVPTRFTMTADGVDYDIQLNDFYTAKAFIFESPITAQNVRFTVSDIRPGAKYSDTCISEITFYNGDITSAGQAETTAAVIQTRPADEAYEVTALLSRYDTDDLRIEFDENPVIDDKGEYYEVYAYLLARLITANNVFEYSDRAEVVVDETTGRKDTVYVFGEPSQRSDGNWVYGQGSDYDLGKVVYAGRVRIRKNASASYFNYSSFRMEDCSIVSFIKDQKNVFNESSILIHPDPDFTMDSKGYITSLKRNYAP